MPKTQTEKLIKQKRNRSGILLPLLEDLFSEPVEVESYEDIEFINNVLERQFERNAGRESQPLFSPSQLSECLRYVFLLKNHRPHDVPKLKGMRREPNFYFFNGNFLHLKWQFALWKLAHKINDPNVFDLLGIEVGIVSKRKDHGGTVDAIAAIHGEPFIVDFKGINVRAFSEVVRGFVPVQYGIQLADYTMLTKGRIKRALLIAENKGGPDPKHPIALHETEIEADVYLPEVKRRLKELRKHDEDDSIPEAECQSTTTLQFQSCPFRKFCREEVKAIQKRREKLESKDAERLKVAVPNGRGPNRSRRNSKR